MTLAEACAAYALVRVLAPELPQGLWNACAAVQIDRGGFLAVRGPGGDLFGLAGYRPGRQGPKAILLVDIFVALEVSAGGPARAMLTAALDRLARQTGCSGVQQTFCCDPGPGSIPAPASTPASGGRSEPLKNHLAIGLAAGAPGYNRSASCHCGSLALLAPAQAPVAR